MRKNESSHQKRVEKWRNMEETACKTDENWRRKVNLNNNGEKSSQINTAQQPRMSRHAAKKMESAYKTTRVFFGG
jgi:hypothetical protein